MPPKDTIRALEPQRASIAAIGNLRSGFVRKIHTTCGRLACHRMRENDPGHGPHFQLVFDADGKRSTRSFSGERAALLRTEVEESQRLRRLTGELIAVSEQLSEARFAMEGPPARRRAKKEPARGSLSTSPTPSIISAMPPRPSAAPTAHSPRHGPTSVTTS